MNSKDLIAHLERTDPKLFEALTVMIAEHDTTTDRLKALTEDLGNRDLMFSHRHNLPNVEVYHSTDQDVLPSNELILSFDSDRVNDYDMHSTTVNNSRITFKEPGDYIIGVNISWDFIAGGYRALHIKMNSAIYIAAVEFLIPGVGASPRRARQAIATFRRCAQDDWAEVTVHQTTSVTTPIVNDDVNTELTPKFWAQMVVPAVNPVTPAYRKLLESGVNVVPYLDRFASRQPQGGG